MGFLASFNTFDLKSLGLLPRMFLVSDGTLTDLLEVSVNEPIAINKLSTSVCVSPGPTDPLYLQVGERLMQRKVLLYGSESSQNYVYAETILAVDRVPPNFTHELLSSHEPLGRLWAKHKLETRKELFHISRHPSGPLAFHFSINEQKELLMRQYCVICGGKPTMLVAEYFPVELTTHSLQDVTSPDYCLTSVAPLYRVP